MGTGQRQVDCRIAADVRGVGVVLGLEGPEVVLQLLRVLSVPRLGGIPQVLDGVVRRGQLLRLGVKVCLGNVSAACGVHDLKLCVLGCLLKLLPRQCALFKQAFEKFHWFLLLSVNGYEKTTLTVVLVVSSSVVRQRRPLRSAPIGISGILVGVPFPTFLLTQTEIHNTDSIVLNFRLGV